MKKIAEFEKRVIADEIVLIPVGATAEKFPGIITLSEVGAFIWDHLEEAQNFEELLKLVLEHYETDQQKAVGDTVDFLNQLLRVGIIRPTDKNW